MLGFPVGFNPLSIFARACQPCAPARIARDPQWNALTRRKGLIPDAALVDQLLQLCIQLFCELGMLVNHVLLFPNILRQVE